MRLVGRTEYGLDPVVRSSSGARRPALSLEPWVTWHWPGMAIDYTGRDVGAVIRAIDAAARARPKPAPNEYNYVIGPDDDELVYEYAGEFQAAHSEGESDDAVGVLFLVGTHQRAITDAQVRKYRWLRDRVLVPHGIVRPDALEVGHREMPDPRSPTGLAPTACPGVVLDRRSELVAPHTDPQEGDPAVQLRFRPKGYANVFEIPSGLHLSGELDAALAAAGVRLVEGIAHPQLMRSLLHRNGLTEQDLVRA